MWDNLKQGLGFIVNAKHISAFLANICLKKSISSIGDFLRDVTAKMLAKSPACSKKAQDGLCVFPSELQVF